MWKDPLVKGRSLGGVTDLTLLATLKPGFVPSLDAVTYKTRVKRLLRTLNAGRSSSHEYALLRPFSDAVERVGVIHSVRVAIVEPAVPGTEPDRLLLSVTFDGGAESYLRILWQKVGTLLDLIFCNTQDYVISHGSRFEDWAGWVRRVQTETDFFYGPPGVTMDDLRYLRADAALRRQPGLGTEQEAQVSVRQTVPGAVEQAWAAADPLGKSGAEIQDIVRQGLQSLVVLHRLAAVHLPGTPDGEVLRRAARSLLHEFLHAEQTLSLFDSQINQGDSRFDEQIRWIREPAAPEPDKAPPLPPAAPAWPRGEVQAGIVEPLPRQARVGALVLLSWATPAAAAALLERLLDGWLSLADAEPAAGRPWVSVALTHAGLRACGLDEGELDALPLEFRQGMAARASVLGDLRSNHPRRWALPRRNWRQSAGALPAPVELDTVHALLQLRSVPTDPQPAASGALDPGLDAALQSLLAGLNGVEVLAVEPMSRHIEGADIVEHFGYADGLSGPSLAPVPAQHHTPQVHPGELLLGHANAAEAAPAPGDGLSERLLHNGSFLVVRKLAQDVPAFERAIEQALKDHPDLDRATLRAKLMGRKDDGTPLAQPIGPGRNDFHFGHDPGGARCPLQAHIRRANPRLVGRVDPPPADPALDPLVPPPGGRPPVLARRGMSFGPRWQPGVPGSDGAARGLMFMAYNASLGEQFEVVQRWLAGGNSTGLDSSQADPFLGVPELARPRTLRFEYTGRDAAGQPLPRIARIVLDGSEVPLADPRPLVRLQWGLYAFAPSRSALAWLADRARLGHWARPWSAARGASEIARLQAIDTGAGTAEAAAAWKALLEDPQSQEDFRAADVWAAIREQHGGVLRTAYGVIVAERALVQQVLGDKAHMSVDGYRERMQGSMGEIFLGLDDTGPGCPYRRQADKTREAIGRLGFDAARELARHAAHTALDRLVADEQSIARSFGVPRWELNLNLKELFDSVLQKLCEAWFGLDPAGPHVVPGGLRWDGVPGAPPSYPGHFMAPSRHIFQPAPGPTAEQWGQRDGQALSAAFEQMLADGWRPRTEAIVGAAIVDDLGHDAALCARTLVGAIMGFVPTLDGTLRQVMHEWLRTGRFWALRERWAALGPGGDGARAEALLAGPMSEAMHLRPSPELIWRRATQPHTIGGVLVTPGEHVVLSLVSAMHQCLELGEPDLTLVFGGQRGQAGDPTHACPGYDAALGATLGVLMALAERADTLRPSPAALSLTLEGEVAPEPALPGDGGLEIKSAARVQGAGNVLMLGDSWHMLIAQPHLKPALEDLGFQVHSVAFFGALLSAIGGRQLSDAVKRIEAMARAGQVLQAIVLCGGGNDVTHEKLKPLVRPQGDPQGPLNRQGVDDIVHRGFRTIFEQILRTLIEACDRHLGAPVPIFVHGYDHPVPDGVRKTFGTTPWLKPTLESLGYTDLAARQSVMAALIDELNRMHSRLVEPGSAFHGRVVHAPLVGVLSGELAGDAYRRDWRDELHATSAGMDKLVRRLVEHMAAHIPALDPPWP